MNRLAAIVAAILSSLLFLPVGCTTIGVVSANILESLDERIVAKGARVHPQFNVVTSAEDEPANPILLKLSSLKANQSGVYRAAQGDLANFTLRMRRRTYRSDDEHSHFSYEVLEDSGTNQLIEVYEATNGGDYKAWSRYRATKDSITPATSRISDPRYAFRAVPFAFGVSLALYWLDRLMRKRMPEARQNSGLA